MQGESPRALTVWLPGATGRPNRAVYAGSEGLRTLVIERHVIGGQAGASSLIRNYLASTGFRSELTQRAYQQPGCLRQIRIFNVCNGPVLARRKF
jgi:hypothetical protein